MIIEQIRRDELYFLYRGTNKAVETMKIGKAPKTDNILSESVKIAAQQNQVSMLKLYNDDILRKEISLKRGGKLN